jgi:microcystin-dependent protein
MTSYCRRPLNFGAHERPTVGDVKISFTSFDHLGWIKCDGSLLSKADFALLYNVIGDKYGVGTATQFRLPDAQGRVTGIVGTPSGAVGTAHAIGSVIGTETHTLIINEMPAHKHGSVDVSSNTNGDGSTTSDGAHSHNINTANAGATVPTRVGQGTDDTVEGPATTETAGTHAHTMGSTGGGAAHNNMQPTLFVGNMFIYTGKTQYGYFPYATGPNLF